MNLTLKAIVDQITWKLSLDLPINLIANKDPAFCAFLVQAKNIRLSEKFLSFYKEIIDAQCFLFYIGTNVIIEIERNGSYLIQ